jgi:ATP-binding cassette, subfamily B, multidrug efflux pump
MAALGKKQADARSLMTGRITDAYTNIATVKLFSHLQRESGYARSAMSEFLKTVYGQMRMITVFEIVNQILSMGMIASMGALTLAMWSAGHLGVGAVAPPSPWRCVSAASRTG